MRSKAALIESEVARRLADRALMSAMTSFVGYVFQALLIRHYATDEHLVRWVAAMAACETISGIVAWRSLRRYSRSEDSAPHMNWQAAALLLTGTCWGCSVFLPGVRDQSLLFVANLCILAVAGVFSIHNLCLHWPSLATFTLGLLAPSAFSGLIDSQSWLLRGGAAMLTFGMLQLYGFKTRQLERREIGSRIAMAEMTLQLTCKNEELADALEANERLAAQDPLTGCMNRRGLKQRYRKSAARRKGDAESLGIIMIDADHFKAVNDTHGHDTGDQVLQALAGKIKSQLRAPDSLARWGGEEFVCVIEGVDAAGLWLAAERIRLAVCEEPVVCKGVTLAVTVSLGVSLLGKQEAFEAAVDRADQALYRAKHSGRNRVGVLDAVAVQRWIDCVSDPAEPRPCPQ